MRMNRIVYVVLIAVLSSACEKNSDSIQRPPHHPISNEFKLYSAFDTNSYWVFQEARSGMIDTLRVISVMSERRFHKDNTTDEKGFRYDAMEIGFESGDLGIVRSEITAGHQVSDTSVLYENLRIYFRSGRYYRILMPRFSMGDTQLLGEQEGHYTNLNFYESFTLNDRNYEAVYHSSVVDYLNAPDTVYLEFHIARHYGLIKYTANWPDTSLDWSLLNATVSMVDAE